MKHSHKRCGSDLERVIPVSLCRRKYIQNKKNKSIIFLLETLLYFKKNHSQRWRASDVLPLHADTGTVRRKRRVFMLRITEITCEHQARPLAIATQHPRFSWKLESDEKDTVQTAYRIQVWTSENQLIWTAGMSSAGIHTILYTRVPY